MKNNNSLNVHLVLRQLMSDLSKIKQVLIIVLVSFMSLTIIKAENTRTLTDQQQKKQISGLVKDVNNEPIIGAKVQEKGNTSNGTVTDENGAFSLSIPANATLHISYIGYLSQEVPTVGKNTMDIILIEDVKALDELIVVGYGSVKKSDLTGSVQRVDSDIYKNQNMSQVTDMLAGTVAGLNMVQSSSAAGGGSIEIRGRTSLNASTTPMIVLDGSIFNGNLRDINPQDVESIEILKDASSSAIYGARAANGVVMISTKKGKKGKAMISFSSQLGTSNTTNDFKPYDKEGYLIYKRDLLRQKNPSMPSYYYDDPNNLPNNVTLDQWRNASDNPQDDNVKEWLSRLSFFGVEVDNYINGRTMDWYKEAIGTGRRQKYDISVSGATEDLSYFWSIDYQKNEGVLRGDDYSVIRSRLNFDFDITPWLNVGINTHFSDRDESAVPVNWKNNLFYMSPYGSMYEEDGSLKWYPNDYALANPFLDYYERQRLRKFNSLFAAGYININLPFGISNKISFQPNYTFREDYDFRPSSIIGGGSGGVGSRRSDKALSWVFDNILSWKRQFNQHSFDVTLLFSSEQHNGWSTRSSNQLFIPNENLGFSGLQFGTNPSVSSDDTKTTADALMGRINYSLLDKYLFTASVRRDGYSAFGVKNPRATFPAFAFAWKLSEEEFFNIPNVYQLKLRASWGRNGNRSIGAYSALARLTSVEYYNGSKAQVGVYNSSLPNDELKWEKTEATNVGIDLGLFDNRLDITGDFYIMNTFDLLMLRQLPEITGFSDIMTNLGQLRNIGAELTINTVNIDKKDFKWTSNFVYSVNRNKIVELFGDFEEVEIDGKIVKREVPDYTNKWFPGEAVDRIWDYKMLGIWQTSEKEEAAKYKLEPGDWKAVDVDNNGEYEALQDKQFIGYTEPRHRVGFRNSFDFLKYFSASLFIRADIGHLAPFDYALQLRGADTGEKRNSFDIPYWTVENPINDYPRMVTRTNVYGGGLMIYKPRTFVRLQDMSFSYSLPNTIIQQFRINSVELYYAGHNLLTFSRWPGWDPESLDSPMYKSHTLGIRITL